MYYCFVEEDIKEINKRDPLVLQLKYAKHLGQYLCCSLVKKIVIDGEGNEINVQGIKIFLRSTYNLMNFAIKLLESKGAILLETLDDIEKIEGWSSYNISKRPIYDVSIRNLVQHDYSSEVKELMGTCKTVFVKSKKKGFSVQVAVRKIIRQESDYILFLRGKCSDLGEELMITESLTIKEDSLGKKEVRLIVLNGEIINASRTLHSVKHFVPPKWTKEAEKIVEIIARDRYFPINYVLDIAEFEREGQRFWDIVELNPITCSICYVNNSVFTKCTDDAKKWFCKTGMGSEYCYDAIFNPESYILERNASDKYEYVSVERYNFI